MGHITLFMQKSKKRRANEANNGQEQPNSELKKEKQRQQQLKKEKKRKQPIFIEDDSYFISKECLRWSHFSVVDNRKCKDTAGEI